MTILQYSKFYYEVNQLGAALRQLSPGDESAVNYQTRLI